MRRTQPPDRETIKDALRDTTRNERLLSRLPLKYAEVIHSNTTYEDTDTRHQAIGLIRNWVKYAEHQSLSEENPFSIRYQVTKFAAETFCKEREYVELNEVDVGEVTNGDITYQAFIENVVSSEVLDDKYVAIIGGTARLALKMHAGIDIQSELPLNDVDMVVSADSDVIQKASDYGFDLTGAKIVDGDISEVLPGLITNFDCTMNQVAVYGGKLLFSDQALTDIKEGNIRIIAKDDPLFGSEGFIMPDGNVYLNRNGFYRGLSFLLRGKGKRLIVSQENIDAEKDNIGRYWLVTLFVKLMTMQDRDAQKDAIANWHEIAKRIGSTETEDPESFFRELVAQHPDMRRYSEKSSFDTDAQARWIVGKLAKKALNSIFEPPDTTIPPTYTEANLELSDKPIEYDYASFVRTVESF